MRFTTSQTNVGAPLTIVGKDLDVGATFNADVNPAAGKQRAGRFMSYDPASKTLSPWDGLADAAGGSIFGVLADDLNTDLVNTEPVMVYRAGTFLRQELEAANNAHIPPGGPLDLALNGKSIFLEYSYEGYIGVDPVPSGAESIAEGVTPAKAKTEASKATAPNPSHEQSNKHGKK